MNGKEITWDEVRKGDWLVVEQDVPRKGARLSYRIVWAGEVVEHTMKGTYLKLGKDSPMLVQHKWGKETITRYMKKEFSAFLKEFEE